MPLVILSDFLLTLSFSLDRVYALLDGYGLDCDELFFSVSLNFLYLFYNMVCNKVDHYIQKFKQSLFLRLDFYWRINFVVLRVFDGSIDVDADDDIHINDSRPYHNADLHQLTEIRVVLHVTICNCYEQYRDNDDEETCQNEICKHFFGCKG